jgi:hypothetical protein
MGHSQEGARVRVIRHQIAITDYQVIDIPAAGTLLSVERSRTIPDHGIDLWSLDYEYGDARTVAIYVVGTGNPMPLALARRLSPPTALADKPFIGTVVTPSGLVWHVFEGPVR